MRRVELSVFDFNEPAIKCYLHVGFKPEGVRRERFHGPDGKFWSEIVMSMLSREWEAARP
jgi:RimJ/RimL family protein N-acetyltransferase